MRGSWTQHNIRTDIVCFLGIHHLIKVKVFEIK